MRIAFVGKGGSGKSVIVGTLARLLARRGEDVLVLDSDVLPGLAFSLGVDSTDAPIPEEAIEENPDEEGPRFRLREGLTAEAAVEQYALRGPDGVRLLQLGKLGGEVDSLGTSSYAFRQIAKELPRDRWHLVGDLPGGTRQPFYGWGAYADTILVVTEPTAKSILSARRLSRLKTSKWTPRVLVVANKVRDEAAIEEIAARTKLEVVAAVPHDEAVRQADRQGTAVVQHDPEAPVVEAVQSLLAHLMNGEVPA